MGLFKRKRSSDQLAVRCPNCHEHIPQGEDECTMCGHDLADVLGEKASGDRVDAGGWSPA